jgi:hypothetical protein
MFTALLLLSGLFWSLTYVLIIARGFRDRSHGMPLAALAANLSWEFLFAFVLPHGPVQRTVNMIWFALDLVLLFQLLHYGPRELGLSSRWFFAAVALALGMAFLAVLFISREFHDPDGAYAAFGQNLMMSLLFLGMLQQRRSLRGQSLGIAVSKMLGTGFASLAFFLYAELSRRSVLLPFLYAAILVTDLIYLAAVWRLARASGTSEVSEMLDWRLS